MTDDQQVAGNLKGMDDLDFEGWNNADWHGVFAHHHTDDVVVDWKGQEPTRGVQEHIDHRGVHLGSTRPVSRAAHLGAMTAMPISADAAPSSAS